MNPSNGSAANARASSGNAAEISFPLRVNKRASPCSRPARTRYPSSLSSNSHPGFENGRSRVSASIGSASARSEEHTSELQSRLHLVCRLLLEKKKRGIYYLTSSLT